MSDLIRDALDRYLMAGMPTPAKREAACRLFCEPPMRISHEQLREILQADAWDL